MTETPPEPTAADYNALTAEETQVPGGEQNDGPGTNRESAKWRRQLRTTEAERDGLGVRILAMQRAEILRIAGDRLAVAADVFTVGGIDMDALLTADGDVDPALVAAAVEHVLTERPGLGKSQIRKTTDLGGGKRYQPPAEPSWSDVLKRP